ncbi:MAG TPA: hypothetical protein VH592_04965 [Gemmataceae bacterium]|jgi:hypothetical protein
MSRDSTKNQPSLEVHFLALVKQWKKDTETDSSITRMVRHPAYQEIISMGEPVVPLLLAELQREPDFWFAALQKITGADPASKASAGKIEELAKAWIEWGRDKGLLQ